MCAVAIAFVGYPETLVEMRAASVNPVDGMFQTGEYGEIPLPSVPGGDSAGVVVSTGVAVDRFTEGDRVAIYGTDRAEYEQMAIHEKAMENKLLLVGAVLFILILVMAGLGAAGVIWA